MLEQVAALEIFVTQVQDTMIAFLVHVVHVCDLPLSRIHAVTAGKLDVLSQV